MSEKIYNVLFLCLGNSARSIMAECALARYGGGRFRAFSAGSHPKGEIHPLTLELLKKLNYKTSDLRSKSWDEFVVDGAPVFDFVFTVCDVTMSESCPVFPGRPMTAHWGVEDPAHVTGTDAEIDAAFMTTYRILRHRIEQFLALPLNELQNDHERLKAELDRISTLLP